MQQQRQWKVLDSNNNSGGYLTAEVVKDVKGQW